MSQLPPKPTFAAPCNHCGVCCSKDICPAGQIAFAGAVAPCPGLRIDNGRALCALVQTEAKAGMVPLIAISLGIGAGCSMRDEDTTDEAFDVFTLAYQQRASAQWDDWRRKGIRQVGHMIDVAEKYHSQQ